MTLGSIIATLRRERGLTQQQAGALMGWSKRYQCMLENGAKHISLRQAYRLAVALDADPADFVRAVLQERLDAAGVALTVLVQPSRERR